MKKLAIISCALSGLCLFIAFCLFIYSLVMYSFNFYIIWVMLISSFFVVFSVFSVIHVNSKK